MRAFTHNRLTVYLRPRGHRYRLSDLRASLTLSEVDKLMRLGFLVWVGPNRLEMR